MKLQIFEKARLRWNVVRGLDLTNNNQMKAVSMLVSGTVLAQAIPVVASPILTRFFSPGAFGKLAIFTSITSILTVCITGRYELAITVPPHRRDAAELVVLATWLAVTAAVALTLIGLGFLTFGSLLGWNLSEGHYLVYAPVAAACVASLSIGQMWFNRMESWKAISKNRITAALAVTVSGIIFGLLNVPGGLIIGYIVGQVVAAIWLYRILIRDTIQGSEAASIWPSFHIARAHRNYPLHIAPAHLVGTIAFQLPVFILTRIYSEDVAGQFSMAYRTITLPTVLVATAIGEVYRAQISRRAINGQPFHDLFLKTLKYTALLGASAGIMGYLLSPEVFPIAFGKSWGDAGVYAQILAIATAFQFALTPLDKGAIVLGKSRYVLAWNALRIGALLTLGIISYTNRPSVEAFLWSLVIINISLYLIDAGIGYQISCGRKSESAPKVAKSNPLRG